MALAKNGRGTDTDDSSISSESSLSSEISSSDEESDTNDLILEDTKLPGTKPINLHDAENKLLRQSYEYDADGNVTVVEPDEEILYPLYPKTILEHLHIDLPSNTIASKADWLQFLKYQPSISQYIDEKTKAGKRILIACYDGTNIGPAILSTFLMTKRGYEREKGGLPYFRLEEVLPIIKEHRSCINFNDYVQNGLQKLQEGLDYRRAQIAKKRLAELYKVI